MSNQPEALRLADALMKLFPSREDGERAAAELRRLHEENESLRQIVEDFPPVEAELREVSDRAHRLEAQRDALLERVEYWKRKHDDEETGDARDALRAQRDALLEALKAMRVQYGQYACRVCDLADAAIKAVEGETK